MAFWRQLRQGLRALARRRAADRDIADEVDHFYGAAVEARIEAGMSAAEALRSVRLEYGDRAGAREEVRAWGWENVLEAVLIDLRIAVRRLIREPAFAAVGILTLALGVGATTAIFSVVKPVFLESLPYPASDRIVMVWDRAADGARADVTFGTYRELTERSWSFEALAVTRAWQPTLTGVGEAERLEGQRVSADWFRVLGASPALGRDFDGSDDRMGGPRVVILSHGLWLRRFGGDTAIVGRTVALDGMAHTVIAVLPRAFENVLAPGAEIWTPLQYDASLPHDGREWGHHLRMMGRLRAEVGLDGARRELDAIAHAPVTEFARPAWAALDAGLIVNRLRHELTRDVGPMLLAVFGAVALLLVIASVNVAGLLLARGARRRGELTVRAALGAGRGRVIGQMLAETGLLALLGGAAGMAVAAAGVRSLVALSPPGLPRLDAIALDGSAFAFGLLLTTAVGVVVGVAPAALASRRDLHVGMRQAGWRNTAGDRAPVRRALVVTQVALALVLLVGAGLLYRSLQRLGSVDPGFRPDRVLTLQVQTSGSRFEDARATHTFFADIVEAVRRVPGVAAVGLTSQLPLSGDLDVYGVRFETRPRMSPDGDAFRYAVSPGYLEAMDITLRRGRSLDESDDAGAPGVALISESLARRTFPDKDPIGQRLHIGRTDLPWYTVVGVVGDVKQTTLAVSQSDAVYVPTAQWYFADRALWLVVRSDGEPAALTPAVRAAIRSVDAEQPIVRIATMAERVAASTADRRFALSVFQAFALVAMTLAAVGVYGILSGSVAERTREIGVRSALGATRTRIVGLVVGQAMTLAVIGTAIGLLAAAAASRALTTLLFGVSRLDPVTYLGVLTLIFGVAAAAAIEPAWRALRVDPATTLRTD